jgi:hypothetical protein
MTPEPEKSIKELCTPLSAKIMPKGYAYSMGSIEMTREEAILKQRHSLNSRMNVSKRKDRRKERC